MIDFKISCQDRDVRFFARVVPLALVVWGTICGLWIQQPAWGGRAHWWFYGAALLLFLWGALSPRTLRPLYLAWSYLTRVLAWLQTVVILGLVFYLGVTLVGLVRRLFRRDPLSARWDREAPSYWIPDRAADPDPVDYERQF